MAIDVSGARSGLAAALFGDTCTIITPGVATSDGGGGVTPGAATESAPVACKFGNVRGDEAAADIVSVRGRYRVKLPIDTMIDERCLVRCAGRVYAVVWAPLPTALSLARSVGLTEAR